MNYLDYYRKKFYLLYKFIMEKQNSTFVLDQVKDLVDVSYKKGNVKKLEKINKELDVWIREMFRPDEKNELLKIIEIELKEDNELIFLDKVSKIINRGKIFNKEEYKMLLQRLEEIYSEKDKVSELTRLNELIIEFHRKL